MANETRDRVRSVGAACGLVLAVFAAPARADEVWVTPTYQQDLGGIGVASNVVWPVTAIGAVRFAWSVPDDMQTFQSAKIALIPGALASASNVNVFVCPAKNHDPVGLAGCFGPFAQPFNGPANQLLEVEIGPLIAAHLGTAGIHYVAVLAYTTPTTTTDHLVGLRFTYAPKLPTGVPTLAANTFTGTQTAPAFTGSFTGDGSGLTNLPVPGGAATLGANTFSGTQTAPAFSGNFSGSFTGNGAGLINVPFPPGAATLGANTFTATQTINGDVDLTGSIRKSGTPFLHAPGTGVNNLGAGLNALFNTTSGHDNVALGSSAGFNATTGSNNIYLGANVQGAAGESNTMYLGKPGVQTKTFIGGVRDVTTASADTLPVVIDPAGQLGTAPASLATLGANTFSGAQTAPAFAGDGSGLTNLPFPAGAATLGANTFSGTQIAPLFAGTFIGNGAGLFNLPFPAGAATLGANTFTATQTIDTGNLDLDASTTSAGNITKNGTLFLHNFGTDNTFMGITAGNTTTFGTGQNVGVGVLALRTNGTGSFNTAAGYKALNANTSGGLNTAVGWSALAAVTSGSQNVAIGSSALTTATIGAVNTAVGYSALSGNGTGTNNVAIGGFAGINATMASSNNIYLGANVTGTAGENNTMYLGKVGQQTKSFIAGVRGITTVNPDAVTVVIDSAGQLGTISSSARFKEDVHDMGAASRRLLQLRPVTFRYTQAFINGAKPIQYGLIAEEVAAVFPELAVRGADGQVETVHYETLNVLLLNELQKHEARADAQERRIEALEQLILELTAARAAN